ncbi:2-isopropylmalate synthase [Clostridium cavendishii DSM 21758]|uniref:Citramalate synthase n=1 Tax=Clostridium cavendishii DSM 21758 TaxID=1121302 RepID=A0A1M6B8X5_9CLOT|nr:citramalate synthase [Clostridium cavendishii]SHI45190.1 2-isopropylmalate synthase [Clostridium cavendishii DSM 21758]
MERVVILDSTLRDGAQGQGISFSVEDKLKVCKVLDSIGIDYIEAGNPGSNPKDMEFFRKVKELKLKKSRIVAFGSTRKANIEIEEDNNLKSLLKADTKAVVIFGKSSEFQVKEILKTSLDENLLMIGETIKFLTEKGKEVIFDGEHFFDGFKQNREYALSTLKIAKESGAKTVVLCDTNGGSMPDEIINIVNIVKEELDCNIGIHCHNDCNMAVANSIMAVKAGSNHIQGTFIGIGERCGNANLTSIIGNLSTKLGYDILDKNSINNLTKAARFIAEISNITLNDDMPYVGNSAFAHKGGMHIDAVLKTPTAYEHINPESVGNNRRFLISEVSGKSTVLKEVQKIFPNMSKESKEIKLITDRLKELEYEGYQFEGAEGTVELVMRKIIGKYKPFFKLNHFKIIGEQPEAMDKFVSTAIMNINVDGKNEITVAEGEGPVNALDKALRKALERFYPELKEVRLCDYKVRVLDTENATSARVRVLIESTDGRENWSTVGVSRDIIKASFIALVDSIEYKLIKDIERKVKTYF